MNFSLKKEETEIKYKLRVGWMCNLKRLLLNNNGEIYSCLS